MKLGFGSFALLLVLCVLATGCSTPPPPIVPVSGVLTIKGEPLRNAEVKFVPMHENLDGNAVAAGVTDKNGKYVLMLPGVPEPGCYACECKILVVEGPMPDAARADSNAGFAAANAYRKSLSNRPIPSQYERVGTTPLTITVTAEDSEYNFEIKR